MTKIPINEVTITGVINAGKSAGYVKAAECLLHWKSGGGRSKTIPSYWITNEKIVSRTINVDFMKYFVKEFTRKARLGKVVEGGTIAFDTTKYIRFGSKDLYYALNNFRLISVASIKFAKKVSEKQGEGEITKLTVLGTDLYDWGTGVISFLSIFEIDQKDMDKFEKSGGAHQYDIYLKEFDALYLLKDPIFKFDI